jgi:hypothetical protein
MQVVPRPAFMQRDCRGFPGRTRFGMRGVDEQRRRAMGIAGSAAVHGGRSRLGPAIGYGLHRERRPDRALKYACQRLLRAPNDQRQNPKKQSLLTQSESIKQRSPGLQRRHAGSAPGWQHTPATQPRLLHTPLWQSSAAPQARAVGQLAQGRRNRRRTHRRPSKDNSEGTSVSGMLDLIRRIRGIGTALRSLPIPRLLLAITAKPCRGDCAEQHVVRGRRGGDAALLAWQQSLPVASRKARRAQRAPRPGRQGGSTSRVAPGWSVSGNFL